MSYTGECNGCGCCCRGFLTVPGKGRTEFHCTNLIVAAGKTLGEPEATRCRIHDKLYPGMPIDLVSAAGDRATSTCVNDYPRPQLHPAAAAAGMVVMIPDSRWEPSTVDAIPPECSYVWNGTDPQPAWHPDFLPVEQLCNTSVLCEVLHRCVVCDAITLGPGHHRRHGCPDIAVRCLPCKEAKRVPDPAKFVGHWEVNVNENMAGKASDGRTVFFEYM